jgi:hypothetical protein
MEFYLGYGLIRAELKAFKIQPLFSWEIVLRTFFSLCNIFE